MNVLSHISDIIIPLQGIIADHIKSGGYFISSGIIDTKEQAVLDAISKTPQLEVIEVARQGEWVSITARRR